MVTFSLHGDKPNGEKGLRFDLAELLALLPDAGPRLHWRVAANREGMQPIFARGATFHGRDEMTFDGAVSRAHGLALTWPEMVELGECTHQTIWGAYLGFEDSEEPDLLALLGEEWGTLEEATSEFFRRVPIAFQAIDSSFWIVHARDDAVRSRFVAAYGPDTAQRIRWAPYD